VNIDKRKLNKGWKITAMIAMIFGIVACIPDDADNDPQPSYDIGFFDAFIDGFSGWRGGFSDIPVEQIQKVEFEFTRDVIEEISNRDNNSIKISGNNINSDLFLYITKQYDSLQPNTDYDINFEIELKVSLEQDTVAEFSPKLYFKAGAATTEPDTIRIGADEVLGYEGFSFNLNKGNGSTSGSILRNLSSIDVPSNRNDDYLATATGNDFNMTGRTDNNGKIWIIFGIESELPLRISYYFNSIFVSFRER